MSIPKHNELRVPVLEYLKNNGASASKDIVSPLSQSLKLTEEEITQLYPSGNGPIFKDRISWALTYLGMSGLINKLGRGIYEISNKGIELLKTPNKVDEYIEKEMKVREASKKESATSLTIFSKEISTPQEELSKSYANIKKSICDEILDTIIRKNPREFENLVVLLLQKMGYGGKIKNAGLVTQATNDKGIDGVIKEDELGLGKIHIQAKRYNQDKAIGREEVQKFVGALAGAQSRKGVFITTSYYSKGAIDFAKTLSTNTSIVLIDGEKLAEYIYDFDLGMQTEQTINIKRMDNDFWDSMQDS